MLNRTLIAVVLAAFVLAAGSVMAESIEIQFTGLDLKYNGVDIVDAKSASGGTGDSALADKLITMSFLKDGNLVGSVLTSDIYADVLIKNVPNVPPGGVVTSLGNGDTFGFDLLTSTGLAAWGLDLNIDKFQVFYTGFGLAVAGTGVASSVGGQSLPFGLQIDAGQQIGIIVSSTNLSNVSHTANGALSGFTAAGTGSIKGVLVPEPSTIAMLMSLVGVAATAMVLRRRRAA